MLNDMNIKGITYAIIATFLLIMVLALVRLFFNKVSARIDGTLADSDWALKVQRLELLSAEEREEDLSTMIVAWIEELSPRTRVSQEALERLTRVVRDRGFEKLESVLTAALAVAGECVEEDHLPVDGYHSAFVDELLKAPKPLAALEERLLREVLDRCGWRMQEAAERVGISRVTLWRKMKDLGIEKNS